MALTAIILFLIFGVLGRIWLQYRLTGDHGVRPAKGTASKSIRLASLLLSISFVSVVTLACLDAFGMLSPQLDLGHVGTLSGALLCLSGLVLTVTAQYQMRRAWRIGVDHNERTALITHGLFSVSRNPIYSGIMIFSIGLLILAPHILMLLALLSGYISIGLQVRKVEEPHLRRLHGDVFDRYCERVNRYFPSIFS